ncbi:2-oxoglutarate dehydrogenase E1 component, partial [Flavobacteriales bacterium]|nr:2-oxoglutarate dehydrogenase E1 component [Flavobacteriales bacterium]
SSLEDLTEGSFQEVIDDPENKDVKNVDKVMFMSGKMYYEILAEQENYTNLDNVALVRIEQMSPLPVEQINEVLKKYNKAEQHFWVQEEPENMGAWGFMLRKFPVRLDYIGRLESSAPAAGSKKRHEKRLKILWDQVFSHAKSAVAK